MLSIEDMKIRVAKYAISVVRDDIVLGVGSGSTSMYFLKELAQYLKDGKFRNIVIVPTSSEVEYFSKILGIDSYLKQPWQVDKIDIAIDGADEVDKNRNLLKGGGGALTGEKIIDYNAKELYIIIDERKLVDYIGMRTPIPIEVIPKYWSIVAKRVIEKYGGDINLRILEKAKRGPLITDNFGYILDWRRILNDVDPEYVEKEVKLIPGVVEVGIFGRSHVTKVFVCQSSGEILEL